MTGAVPPVRLPRVLSAGRFAAFALTCLLGTVLLEDVLTLGSARPDFTLVLLVYGAIRWGGIGGASLGFALGIFRDVLMLSSLGLHGLAMTILGYSLGKLRDTLYLSAPAVDVLLLAAAKLLLEVVILSASAAGSWVTLETRFFWEAPLGALYTALLGGLLHRLFHGR